MDSPFHAAIPAHHHPGWSLGPDSHSWFVFERQRQHWVQFATPDVAPTHGSFKQVTLAMGLDEVSPSQISPCRGVVPPLQDPTQELNAVASKVRPACCPLSRCRCSGCEFDGDGAQCNGSEKGPLISPKTRSL